MALPFLNDNLINLYSDVLSNQETTPQGFNEDNVFRIPEEYLLSDSNIYTDPNTIDVPVEATEDGIASVNTSLPMYIRDDNDNLFSEYSSMDGAPAYIRPIKTDTLTDQNPNITKIANYNELFGPKTFTDSLGNVRTIPGEERFTFPKEKVGIMQAAKDKGNALLDFIKDGGITGFAARTLFGEEDPRASFLRDYYGGEDGSNLKNGTIQGGLMAGYNPVSGGLFGSPATYGLQNAYARRIKAIENTIKDKYKGKGSETLVKRLAKLREEKRKEAAALEKNRLERLARDNINFDPSGPTQQSIRDSRPDLSGKGQSSGFTNPGKGSYGPYS